MTSTVDVGGHTPTVTTTLPDADTIDKAMEELITEEMNAKGFLSLDGFVGYDANQHQDVNLPRSDVKVKVKDTVIDHETHTESNLETRGNASDSQSDAKQNRIQ